MVSALRTRGTGRILAMVTAPVLGAGGVAWGDCAVLPTHGMQDVAASQRWSARPVARKMMQETGASVEIAAVRWETPAIETDVQAVRWDAAGM